MQITFNIIKFRRKLKEFKKISHILHGIKKYSIKFVKSHANRRYVVTQRKKEESGILNFYDNN